MADDFHLYYLGDDDANKPEGFDDVDLTDGIDEINCGGNAEVISSTWYTLAGMRVARPETRGIYIRLDRFSDGTEKSNKILVK